MTSRSNPSRAGASIPARAILPNGRPSSAIRCASCPEMVCDGDRISGVTRCKSCRNKQKRSSK